MAEVPFRPALHLSEYKGKGASASREELFKLKLQTWVIFSEISTPNND